MRTSPATCGISAIPWPTAAGDLVVATTRPETMMGDTGVAVNPEDERYQRSGGQDLHPAHHEPGDPHCGRRLRGAWASAPAAVKMTPAHDPNDFEVGLRHNLEVIRVHRRRRQDQRERRPLPGDGPLRVPQGRSSRTWRSRAIWSRSSPTTTTWAPATAATTTWSP